MQIFIQIVGKKFKKKHKRLTKDIKTFKNLIKKYFLDLFIEFIKKYIYIIFIININ